MGPKRNFILNVRGIVKTAPKASFFKDLHNKQTSGKVYFKRESISINKQYQEYK